ncbi:MAG: small ribosomal subunit biogenesis GTPase RsgA [Moraxellaceae bacterium]|jgi:ribosome biogenesis GTPase|nr:small ribosomal subunit biogenesis GTPase RsgA [Moraxellaceae bacterium]MBP9045830.1 small ribosomal subunit biogenesis GTPase RsgA [Moraxellaceae bacterium]MBP9730505.1 small ribosomal subunit biogenesis GTPase RsgA [Moraxellaceae bacterium]
MSKRKLTRQQTHRIQRIQDERIARAGKREATATAMLESGDLAVEEEGLVMAHYGTQIDIEALGGERAGQVFRCHLRANLEHLVTGDRVIWQASLKREEGRDAIGVVTALQPRETLLVRPDPYGKLKPVAANIDRILLVISPFPEPSALLVDRYLVACELTGIRPVILLNKADLITPAMAPLLDALLAQYSAIGYEVRTISAGTGQLQDLKDLIGTQTVVFVGQSGVGKSSIINVLLPEAAQKVSAISDASRLGQHTTTTARLFHLPDGGILIDSPGIREFGLWHVEESDLLAGYIEFAPFVGTCRFRNCAHRNEPGCALRLAAEEGKINPARLERFQVLRQNLERPQV